MKNLIIISLLAFMFGCSKENSIKEELRLMGRSNNPFPISVYLGADTSYFRVDSCSLVGAYSYLPTCGLPPEFEAPNMGTEVYQIAGATTASITGTFANIRFGNLTTGKYTFVGHAYMTGYRLCDSSYVNENAYDTINITILKNRKKK